jgi:hypothetical protein
LGLGNSTRIGQEIKFTQGSVTQVSLYWRKTGEGGVNNKHVNNIMSHFGNSHYVTDTLNSYSSFCAHITDLNTSIMMMTMIPIMKVKLTKSTLHMTYETMLQKMINFSMAKDHRCTSYKS